MQQDFMDYTEEVSNGYALADTGIYELKIENAELKQTENGKNYISLTFVIRDDVEQIVDGFAGVKIKEAIWENEVYRDPQKNNRRIRKDEYEAMPTNLKQNIIVKKEYDDLKIRTLVHAQNADVKIKDANGDEKPNPNFRAKFSSIDEVAQFLNGMCVQAKVVKSDDERRGREVNSIDFRTVKRTSVPEEIADDDLPF